MKKILLTGANGLLGQKLVMLLAGKEDIQLVATGRGPCRIEGITAPYEYLSMDITSHDNVMEVFDKVKPTHVINSAAMTNVDQCESEKDECRAQNVLAVEYMIAACRKHNAFLLHLSTDFIFDGEAGPYDEDAPASPISYYGQSKADAEALLFAAQGIQWAIARTVLVYGLTPNMSRSNIILWVKSSLEAGKTIKVVNDQWRTPTLAEDLAMGCYLIVEQEAQGVFNISGKDFLNPFQMAIKTADYFGLDKSLIQEVDGTLFSQPAKRPPKTGFTIEKARNVLGYEPHSFDEGIALLAGQLKDEKLKN